MYNKFSVCVLLKIAEMEVLLLVKDCYTDTLHYTNYSQVIPHVHNSWQQKVPVFTYLCVSVQSNTILS